MVYTFQKVILGDNRKYEEWNTTIIKLQSFLYRGGVTPLYSLIFCVDFYTYIIHFLQMGVTYDPVNPNKNSYLTKNIFLFKKILF